MTICQSKRVVITGAGSGLGRALALRFAKEHCHIAISDRDIKAAEETLNQVKNLGGQGFAMSCDVTRSEDFQALADRIQQEWKGVDIVINNAGVPAAGPFTGISMDIWKWIIDINLLGVIRGCQTFIPTLIAQKAGHIVNIASAAGIAQLGNMSPYNVTKTSVISLSETLRIELAEDVQVSVVCPSFFKSNLIDSFRGEESARQRAKNIFSQANLSADQIAERIYQGVVKNQFLILPDTQAKALYFTKRFFPGLLFRGALRRKKKISKA